MTKKLLITSFLAILFFITQVQTGQAKSLSVFPNDPYFHQQSHLKQIKATDGWNYSTGNPDIVVAVIDAGIDIDHPDLKNNIWLNQKEIPNNNLDDDHNAYVDDLYGWDFVENSNDPRPKIGNSPNEPALTHGTIVAGLVSAEGNNNQGVVGVAWQIKIMALRSLDDQGNGSLHDASRAILYAADNGADVINMSFVGANTTQEFANAIKYAYKKGVLLVAAVGNDAIGAEQEISGGDLDERPLYPVCLDGGKYNNYIIGVGGVNSQDVRESFSNYGTQCIDISAPSSLIVSTQFVPEPKLELIKQEYGGYWAGTSFAAPQVSATAALMKGASNLNNNQITAILLATADKIGAQNPKYKGLLGAGRLNVYRALKAVSPLQNAKTQSSPQTDKNFTSISKSTDLYKSLWNSSELKSQVLTNEYIPVKIKFKNKGSKAWQKGEIFLSVYDKQGMTTAFAHPEWKYKKGKIKFLNEINVSSNELAEFSFLIRAPELSGKYKLVFTLEKWDGKILKGGKVYKEIVVENFK